jgi:hypothetical protein
LKIYQRLIPSLPRYLLFFEFIALVLALAPQPWAVNTCIMPSATGSNWEKYQKNFADDEEPEKKITPLSERSVS